MASMGILLVLSFFGQNAWWTAESEVFYIIGEQHIYMTADSFYVADHLNSQLIQFDRNGKRVKVVARKGQGPEDINHPISIFDRDDHVYVMGIEHLKVFGPEGFVRAVRLPLKGLISVHPVANGWAYTDHALFVGDGDSRQLYLANHTFGNTKTLVTWSSLSPPPEQLIKSRLTNDTIRTGRPDDLSFLMVSKDGKTIFFRQIYTTTIQIFDGLTGVVRNTFETDSPIGRMSVGPYGNLYIRQKDKRVRVIDKDGNEIPATLPFYILGNLIEIKDGWAYWRFYDFEKDDLILGGCRETVIDKFLKAHATRFNLDLN